MNTLVLSIYRFYISDKLDQWSRNRLINRIEAAGAQYLPLLWPVRQLGAAFEPNDIILTNLMMSHYFNPIP